MDPGPSRYIAQAMQVRVLSQSSPPAHHARPAAWRSILTHTHTYSGRADHGGAASPSAAYAAIASWAKRRGIDAIATGSPYEPISAANYGRYDGDPDLRYYSQPVDPQTVMDRPAIAGMLRDLNTISTSRPTFFLDNETPKGRFGHLWWINYHYDLPAWHHYDQPFDRWMTGELAAGDYDDEPTPYERRPYAQIVGTQRSAGALGIWAHPTSWWRGERGQFITNIAAEAPTHAAAEGFLDGLVVMGYHAYRPQYLELWYSLLDRGYRVPGVAEMDCSLSDPRLWQRDDALLTLAPVEGEITPPKLARAFAAGRLVATSGPFVEITVDGVPMGGVAPTAAGRTHRVELCALSAPGQQLLGEVQLIGSAGVVVWRRRDFPGGRIELAVEGSDRRGYVLAAAFGAGQNSTTSWRDVKQFAVANPVYLHAPGQSFARPQTTTLTLNTSDPLVGAKLHLESAAGELLDRTTLRGGTEQYQLPATGRITVVPDAAPPRTLYLINANAKLQSLHRHLYRGRFLRDFPNLSPGEVPPAAWQLAEFPAAIERLSLRL